MRELLGSPKIDDSEREKLFKKMFGYFDKGIYQMMTNKFKKLYESVINGAPDPKDVKKMRKKLDRNDKERKYSGNKKYQYEPTNEDIHIPVKVGDTVVMGRFKNKKVKVKSIDVNEKGDVIINGRSAMKFRIYQRGDSEVTGIEHYADSIKVTNEEIFNFLLKYDIEEILNEASTGNSGQAPPDSGPGAYFKSFPAYKIDSIVGAQKLGMKVVKYILSGGKDDEDDYPIYGEDNIAPVPAVSWFPAGVSGKHTANNQIDLIGTEAWDAWIDHMNPIATSIGYKLIDELQFGDWDEEELKDTSTEGSKETLKVMNKEQPPDTKIKGKKQKPKSIEEVIDISNLIKELTEDWWTDMSPEAQKAYISQHKTPKSVQPKNPSGKKPRDVDGNFEYEKQKQKAVKQKLKQKHHEPEEGPTPENHEKYYVHQNENSAIIGTPHLDGKDPKTKEFIKKNVLPKVDDFIEKHGAENVVFMAEGGDEGDNYVEGSEQHMVGDHVEGQGGTVDTFDGPEMSQWVNQEGSKDENGDDLFDRLSKNSKPPKTRSQSAAGIYAFMVGQGDDGGDAMEYMDKRSGVDQKEAEQYLKDNGYVGSIPPKNKSEKRHLYLLAFPGDASEKEKKK